MTAHEAGHDESVDHGSQEPLLLYDGECPFCRLYASRRRLDLRAGRTLRRIDGREAPALVARMREEGCDLDDGMILVDDGRRFHGAAAMSELEAMTAGTGPFDRFARWFASSPARMRRLYPWLRRLRSAALRVKGAPGFRA